MTTFLSKARYVFGLLLFIPGSLLCILGLIIGAGRSEAKRIFSAWALGLQLQDSLIRAIVEEDDEGCGWPFCTPGDCACDDNKHYEQAETYAENIARLDAEISAAPHLPITKEQ